MPRANGAELRRERVARGLSQLDLADLAGVRQATVSNVENGRPVRPSTIRKIATALGIEVSAVLQP